VDYTAQILDHPLIVDARTTLARHRTKTWGRRDPALLKGVCFHQSLAHNGSAAATAKYDVGENHMSPDGLPSLSYTLFVDRENTVHLANAVEEKTWSQGDASKDGDENALYLAVCFGGNFSGPGYMGTQQPSPFQITTAASLWFHCKKIWGWHNNQLFGHYDFGKPACPGDVLGEFIEGINSIKDWPDTLKCDLSTVTGRQQALQLLGFFTGRADGVWTVYCKGALIRFQRAANLDADGVWGKFTEAAVIAALAKI
jgi:hypothetical protein